MIMEKTTNILIACIILFACEAYSNNLAENTQNSTDAFDYILLKGRGDKHPCIRTCVKNEPPMVCKYVFRMEWYQTLTKACFDCPYKPEDCLRPHCIPGDGNKRPVLVVNRQMPGPSVEVCLGDEVVVDVENSLLGESTTIHWHGHHQRHTPYMDGVPFVTQCPIQPASTFRYHFKAVHRGTHFWHSHTGFQRADGAFGAYIVRVPESDNHHKDLYDHDLSEHIIITLDWGPEVGMAKFIAHHHSNGDNKPKTLLVDGLGRFKKFEDAVGGNNDSVLYTPTARYIVEKGSRYRFRVINAGFLNCPIEIAVDNHKITVISSDGNDFAPVVAESVVTYAGERFDFILDADQTEGVYWMRFRGLMDCDERFKSAHQVAVLQYQGASNTDYPEDEPNYEKSHKDGFQVNALNKGTGENNSFSIAEVKALQEWDVSLKPEADAKFFIAYDFYTLDNPHFHRPGLYAFFNISEKNQQLLTPQLNHISLKLLPFPLLTERNQLDTNKFCNESTVKNCIKDYCECLHVLQVPLNSVVEIILIDRGFAYDANHPFHLHGHSFRVVGMERLGKNTTEAIVKKLDREGKLHRNLVNPPLKDTVTVPDGGYTILRFHASNPGYWLFHCHIEFHIEIGMALVFKVGEHSDMLPIPKNFPTCGNYMPNLETNEKCKKDPSNKLTHGDCSNGNENLIDRNRYLLSSLACIILFYILR